MTKIFCDKCNKELEFGDWVELQERHTIKFQGGYGSVFGDGSRVLIDLCQHCLKSMLEKEGLLHKGTVTEVDWGRDMV